MTIYRRCPCGETAHDYTGEDTAEGHRVHACRNCRARRVYRKRGRSWKKLTKEDREIVGTVIAVGLRRLSE